MQSRSDRQGQRGSVGMVIIAVVMVLTVVAAGLVVHKHLRDSASNAVTTTPNQSDSNKADSAAFKEVQQRNARNLERKNDASNLGTGVSDFYGDNITFPTSFVNGVLLAGKDSRGHKVTLNHYKTISISSGRQSPLTNDELRLILEADCEGDEVIAGESSRVFAVQYTFENDDTVSSKCLAG
ncbi:MAG TPA: hypothetical protein VJ836_05550 [Candidatus Saccharimonadales bacterium]|nr:hypothetical protein [Candidatus Saccharimonadales bacterium]